MMIVITQMFQFEATVNDVQFSHNDYIFFMYFAYFGQFKTSIYLRKVFLKFFWAVGV